MNNIYPVSTQWPAQRSARISLIKAPGGDKNPDGQSLQRSVRSNAPNTLPSTS